jgi:hypothetical protein
MKEWLEDNPNGLKHAFEEYFKALPADVRKVSDCSESIVSDAVDLTLFYIQKYKDNAAAAVRLFTLGVLNITR